jgi:hypothetical protein
LLGRIDEGLDRGRGSSGQEGLPCRAPSACGQGEAD